MKAKRKTQGCKDKLQCQAIWKKSGAATQLQKLQINGRTCDVCVHFEYPLRKAWMPFAEDLRVLLVHEVGRHADIRVRYGLTKSDVTLVKTICRDYGRNPGTSERNVKSGKRPKSKSPSELPAARHTSSANDPTPSHRTTTASAPKPHTIAATSAADEDAPSATRHSTPDDLGDDSDDDGYEARLRIASRQHPSYIPVRNASSRNFKLQYLFLKPLRCGFELFKASVSKCFGCDFNDDERWMTTGVGGVGGGKRQTRHHPFTECRAWAPQIRRLWRDIGNPMG